jgi:hypothetical protein
MRLLWVFAVLVSSALAADDGQNVILATRRAGRVEVFDAGTLQPLGTIGVDPLAESIAASPDGHTLFIAQATPSRPNSCCGLLALNLDSKEMCFLRAPALRSTPSPDGRKLFLQRGNVGIDVFDAKTLVRLPTIKAPGNYTLQPSPDGRWLMGTTNWKGPAVDIFDVAAGAMVRHIDVPYESSSGAWAGDRFLLYGFDGHQGALWTLTPDSTTLGSAIKIAIPDIAGNCQPLVQNLAVGGDHLFLYELFGGKLDRRDNCRTKVPGGVFEIEASTGAVLTHLASSLSFGRLTVSADGEHLYGIGISDRWTGIRLVEVERKTGDVVAEQRLEDDVWNITLARIPAGLVPRGYVTPAACSKPLQ